MPVVERAGRQQNESDQSRDGPADAPAQSPGDKEADEADGGADEPARREQAERQNLGGKRGQRSKPPPYM